MHYRNVCDTVSTAYRGRKLILNFIKVKTSLVAKPEAKTQLQGPKRRWENNIKADL